MKYASLFVRHTTYILKKVSIEVMGEIQELIKELILVLNTTLLTKTGYRILFNY